MAGTEARPTGTEARPTGTEARPTSTGARPTECWLLACRSKLRLRFEGSYLLQRMTAKRNWEPACGTERSGASAKK